MTVLTTIAKAGPYAGAGTTGPFTVPFRFLDAAHLRVIRNTAGVETVLALGTDYTVSGVGATSGTVTLVAPLPVGQTLTVVRNVPATQEADYVPGDSFPAESHEQALDKLTMITQQQQEQLGRAVIFPTTDESVSELPPADQRSLRVLGFDTNGGLTTYDPASQVTRAENVSYLPSGTGAVATNVQSKLRESVSVLDFGADPTGATNSTDAFVAASAYINAQGGGKLVIPKGTYIVGKQTFAGAGGLGYSYRPSPIIQIQNCTLPVVVESYGAKLKLANGLRFGSFDPVTGAVFNPATLPFTDLNYRADAGIMIQFFNNSNVTLTGAIELDGNIANVIPGGMWGDTGRQCIAYGVWAYNNEQCTIENVWSHHHALDGMISGYNGITSEGGVAKPITLTNCVFENNARQGWSITGGRGVTAINCKFNNTGKDIPFASSPGAGCDIEAEMGWIRDVLFLNCEFSNNISVGLVADSGNSANVTALRCKFIGTTQTPIWPRKPGMVFRDCLIVGSAVNAFQSATNPNEATKFYNCVFTDQTIYSPTGVVFNGNYLADFNSGTNVLLDGCTFHATTQRNLNLGGGILRNSVFVCQAARGNRDYLAVLNNVSLENLTVLDQIELPAADGYYIAFNNVKYRGVNFINSPNSSIKWWSWSPGAGGVAGYLGESTPNESAAPYLSVIKGGGSHLLGFHGTADTYWGTAAPGSGTYKVGDRFFNSNPTVGQPKSWVCTVAGTPGTWVTEGRLFASEQVLTGTTSTSPETMFTMPQDSTFIVTVGPNAAASDDRRNTYIVSRQGIETTISASLLSAAGGSGRQFTATLSGANVQINSSTGAASGSWTATRVG